MPAPNPRAHPVRRFPTSPLSAVLIAAAAVLPSASAEPVTIELWPNGTPTQMRPKSPETEKLFQSFGGHKPPNRVTDVTNPTMAVYPSGKPESPAVIVAPGGGYMFLSYQHEGTQVCDWLNSLGITAVLLKYRTPTRDEPEHFTLPVQDSHRAMGILRHRAHEWQIDPQRVGILGFSAGANLAGHAAWDRGQRTYPQAPDLDDPRGHGHMLQCLGNEPCHFILVFDNGYFSEFGTFSLTDWLGHVPPAVLAKNLGVPAATFQGFPKEEVYFARGPVPPEPAAPPLAGIQSPPLPHRHSLRSQMPLETFKGGREWRVEAKDFPISSTMTGVVLEMDPGTLRELHWHPNADEWQYVLDGTIRATLFGSRGRYREATLNVGDVGYIPQGYGHSLENVGPEPARILIVFNSGTYETIDVSQWIAGQPADVLAVNFGQPAAMFGAFPKRDVFMTKE
jgi:oxalate decarboxylase/phosphoglucose isomerase-like protein (cupin superfamily)